MAFLDEHKTFNIASIGPLGRASRILAGSGMSMIKLARALVGDAKQVEREFRACAAEHGHCPSQSLAAHGPAVAVLTLSSLPIDIISNGRMLWI